MSPAPRKVYDEPHPATGLYTTLVCFGRYAYPAVTGLLLALSAVWFVGITKQLVNAAAGAGSGKEKGQ